MTKPQSWQCGGCKTWYAPFIEKCEWDAERGAAMPTLRDNDNPLDVSTVVQG
jgi:hypothetical protein